MSSHLEHTIRVDGFDTVTIRSLTKGRVKRIRAIVDPFDRASEMIKRGLVEPPFTMDVVERLGKNPPAYEALAQAILDRSWPNEARG